MNEAKEFLHALFDQKHERAAMQVWVRSQPALTWFLDNIDAAAHLAVEHRDEADVYIACGMANAAEDRPRRTRLKAHEVVGIPGVWADIDVNGGPDAKDGAAPTQDAALELARSLLEPTLIVHSGYGIQSWWLWEDGPMMFRTRDDQEHGKRLVAGFQGALRAASRRAGWGLDATQDLARVMRIPDTFNHKGSTLAPVRLLEHGGKLYTYDEVGEFGQGVVLAPEAGSDAIIEVRRGAPIDMRVMVLLDTEPEFGALWEMKKGPGTKRRDWSPSEYELAIANWLVRAGLNEQEMADAIVYWRNKIEPGDPRGKIRRERIAATIAKAMNTVSLEEFESAAEAEREAASASLQRITHGIEQPTEGKALGAFNRIIGGPEISRLFQFGRDPTLTRYSIELADGTIVSLGGFETLQSQATFRRVYANMTGHYPAQVKAQKWDAAVAALLKVAVVNNEVEDTASGRMMGWIDEYVDASGSSDKDGACFSKAPFIEEGKIHLTATHFLRYLRRTVGEKIEQADLTIQLRTLGYERKNINYRRADGTRSTRSYFVETG